MTMDRSTSFVTSPVNNKTRCGTVAPSAFRKPISFVRCSVVKETSPKIPMHHIKIAMIAKTFASMPIMASISYMFLNC